jgi:hypothetical protein
LQVALLIQGHNEHKHVNLMKLKSHLSRRNGLQDQPKTVEIIAAIPEQFRKGPPSRPENQAHPYRLWRMSPLLSSPLLLVAYAKPPPPPYRAPDTRVLLVAGGWWLGWR